MDIYWGGQALFRIKGKNASVILDPFGPDFTGLKLPKDLTSDIVLSTHDHKDHNNTTTPKTLSGGKPMVFKDPGEYEVCGVVVTGISSFHDNSEGSERGKNTIFHLMFDGLNIVHLGDLGQSKLTEEQVSQIGQTDILLIPVGGVYTIGAEEASQVVSKIEPSFVIPMHYANPKLNSSIFGQLASVDNFLLKRGISEAVEPTKKLILKKSDIIDEETKVVVMEASV